MTRTIKVIKKRNYAMETSILSSMALFGSAFIGFGIKNHTNGYSNMENLLIGIIFLIVLLFLNIMIIYVYKVDESYEEELIVKEDFK